MLHDRQRTRAQGRTIAPAATCGIGYGQLVKRGQVVLIVLAVLAVAAVAFLRDGGDKTGGGTAKAPPRALRVPFVYSPEKDKLLRPLIAAFNRERNEVAGQPVFVEGESMSSGEAQEKIARGRLKPVAWSPASSLWGRLLNFEADRSYVAARNQAIVRTPLVIAMWEPMARALGYPGKKLGFADVLKLATSGKGWAEYGHPEFGDFKLVHTNPDFSTSGLSAVVAEYYSATGKKEGLTAADVRSKAARKAVRGIERSIVHYGDTTLFIADQMRERGPGYASAAAMEEVTLLDFNRTRGTHPKLVAIYPREGTFYSDNPFIVLDAPWVDVAEKEAARSFQRFLAKRVTPELAARFGFRPPGLDQKPVDPITRQNGVDPAQPERVLGLPGPRVLATIKATWRRDRKPANVLLVVDTSGSMIEEDRLARAKVGLEAFLKEAAPQDRVGLMEFSDEVSLLVPISAFRDNALDLQEIVQNLIAGGGTAFLDATSKAFDEVRGRAGPDAISAVVLLTDGEDTDSSLSLDRVIDRLASQGDRENPVRIFTIAYSAGAEGAIEALEKIASASGGKAYIGETDDIAAVYRSISSFF